MWVGAELLRLQEALSGLPADPAAAAGGSELCERDRLALEAVTQLRLVSLDRLVQSGPGSVLRHDLDQTMARVTHLLTRLSEVIAAQYFAHLRESRQLAQARIENS